MQLLHPVLHLVTRLRAGLKACRCHAGRTLLTKAHRTVRVDEELLAEVENLTRKRLVPRNLQRAGRHGAAASRTRGQRAPDTPRRRPRGRRPPPRRTDMPPVAPPQPPVGAGEIWERSDGLKWVEVQAAGVEPSGCRLMIPLVPLEDAHDAPATRGHRRRSTRPRPPTRQRAAGRARRARRQPPPGSRLEPPRGRPAPHFRVKASAASPGTTRIDVSMATHQYTILVCLLGY